jgi:hypothetical protein
MQDLSETLKSFDLYNKHQYDRYLIEFRRYKNGYRCTSQQYFNTPLRSKNAFITDGFDEYEKQMNVLKQTPEVYFAEKIKNDNIRNKELSKQLEEESKLRKERDIQENVQREYDNIAKKALLTDEEKKQKYEDHLKKIEIDGKELYQEYLKRYNLYKKGYRCTFKQFLDRTINEKDTREHFTTSQYEIFDERIISSGDTPQKYFSDLINDTKNKDIAIYKESISKENREIEEYKKSPEKFQEQLVRKYTKAINDSLFFSSSFYSFDDSSESHGKNKVYATPETHPEIAAYQKPKQSKNIEVVTEDNMCNIPGCTKPKIKNSPSNMCAYHKCKTKDCQKRTHPKHGVFCKECDSK